MTEVDGDVLRLSRSEPRPRGFFGGIFGGLLEDYRVRVYLNFVQLSAIEAFSGSDVHGRNEMCVEQLTVDAAGGSDVEVHGNPGDKTVSSDRSSDVRWL